MILPSLPKKFPTAMLVSLLVNGALLGQGWDNAGPQVVLDVTTDKVGIGTSNPLAKLDISATGNGAEVLRLSTERAWTFRQSGTGAGTQLELHALVDAKNFKITALGGNIAAQFFTSDVSNLSRVYLVPDGGRVGIGTTRPSQKLHVNGNIMTGSNGFLYLGGTDVFWQDEVGNLVGSTTSTFTVNYDSNNNGTGVFRIITGGSDVLLIDNAGNVGIGTSSPLYKLDVAGHVGFKDKLSGGNTTNGAVIHLRFDASFQSVSNVWRYRIGGSPTAGGFALGFFDDVPNLWLESSGNVGI